MKKLEGKLTLITGASKGLGKAMALALAAEGAKLALVSRDQKLLDQTAAEVRVATGTSVDTFLADVTDEAQVARLEADVRAKSGRVQILINNAGINIRKPLASLALADWNAMLGTNLTGPFLVTRAFLPHLKGAGWGRIINMTSMLSHVALAERTGYCASKFGLLGFTKALALELAADGITVNGISPGPCATDINKPILEDPAKKEYFMARLPVGRFGKVEEIGALAVFLCSDEAGFITGTDITADGGWTAQ
ncbi:MAG: SDR family oxidoreductase [Verrucomicrobia bacterium]|nr:SDR family oxidoreductase [Verrucomicrobiota bacterium]